MPGHPPLPSCRRHERRGCPAKGRACGFFLLPAVSPMAALTREPECLTLKATAADKPAVMGGDRMFARQYPMLGACALVMLASTCAQAQVSDDAVKIGVLTDMNGPASTPTGQGSVT